MTTTQEANQFLNEVTQWASTRADIQALALVGSYARGAAKATSDVDLVVIARKPKRYLHNLNWIKHFGSVKKHQIEDYGLLTSVRVWYVDGLEIEYGLTGEIWAAEPLDDGTRRVIEDGMQILFERSDLLSRHQTTKG